MRVTVNQARQAALVTLALPSTVERLGARRAASYAREVWRAMGSHPLPLSQPSAVGRGMGLGDSAGGPPSKR